MKDPLRILMVSSEVAPFAKTGGLADVSAALCEFLAGAGQDVRLVMPLYASVRGGDWEFEPDPKLRHVPLEIGDHAFSFSVTTAPLPGGEARVWFVDCPELYGRQGIYTSDTDEHLRWGMLSRAAIAICQYEGWSPDIVHCNDWHTGLLPLYLKARYAWDRLLADTKSVLTIHNIGYQGIFPSQVLAELDLQNEQRLFHQDDLRDGQINYLKTGLIYADALTTVSETYAREIQTEELGMGLHEVLRARSDSLRGIVNGIDYTEWNPKTDERIPENYSSDALEGKLACKRALLAKFELDEDLGAPLLGVVSRLTGQKGFELLPDVLPVFLQRHNVRLTVLGSGEEKYEEYFQWLRNAYPDRVGFYRGYSEDLAHWIEAGSDMFLMPSRYEPCGLNQMYSLRYGTIPIVRATGGLADTVVPFDPVGGEGTGFRFDEFTSQALFDAIRSALEAYADRSAWRAMMLRGMAADFSWERQGRHYLRLYEELTAG